MSTATKMPLGILVREEHGEDAFHPGSSIWCRVRRYLPGPGGGTYEYRWLCILSDAPGNVLEEMSDDDLERFGGGWRFDLMEVVGAIPGSDAERTIPFRKTEAFARASRELGYEQAEGETPLQKLRRAISAPVGMSANEAVAEAARRLGSSAVPGDLTPQPETLAQAHAQLRYVFGDQHADVRTLVRRATLALAEYQSYEAGPMGAFIEGWMAAREDYGVTDDEDAGGKPHGAECARVQGPYECTCDPKGQRAEARRAADHMGYTGVDEDTDQDTGEQSALHTLRTRLSVRDDLSANEVILHAVRELDRAGVVTGPESHAEPTDAKVGDQRPEHERAHYRADQGLSPLCPRCGDPFHDNAFMCRACMTHRPSETMQQAREDVSRALGIVEHLLATHFTDGAMNSMRELRELLKGVDY